MSAAFLKGEATCVALCLRLLRRDGIALGFTTHDRGLHVAGLHYQPVGVTPSAVVQSLGTEGDTWEVALPLIAEPGAESGGAWLRASARLFATDWRAPEAERVEMAAGTVTAVRLEHGSAALVVSGAMAVLGEAGPVMCSPTCRAMLGDAACGIDMAERRVRLLATSAENGVEAWTDLPLERFVHGRLRVRTGLGAGRTTQVVALSGRRLELRDGIPAGEAFEVELSEGCDRRFATCAARFSNAANFRGEPHVPGTDSLLRRG